jgi:CheY-like chemotaxis protein
MAESPAEPTREEFARWVQEALHRLYDSPFLQKHPLTELLAGDEPVRLQRVRQLRRILLDAIQSLAPGEGAQAQSPDWRAFRILELRYIEGLTPSEVMQQLALSRSYYFREQARMLEAVTTTLWEQWRQRQPGADPADLTREQIAHAETSRLSAQASWEPVDPVQVLRQLHPMVESLARAQRVELRVELPEQLVTLQADRVMLRQALFNVITYGLDVASGGQLLISSFAARDETGICVRVERADPGEAATQRQGVGLEVGGRFMTALGGALHVAQEAGGRWEARLAWPAETAPVLLVVDDNQDFADLFRRYLAGLSWQVLSAADGAQARQILAQLEPRVIILDVMMPREDGWELLMALRADQATRDTPIIICSVLNEPRLAETLGASGYLTKPVTQQALLRALAPWGPADASPAPAR